MIVQSENLIIYNEYFYIFFLFIVSFLIAFIISKLLGFKSIKSIIAFHSIILFIFVFIELLDYFFILIAIIELIVMFKLGANNNENN